MPDIDFLGEQGGALGIAFASGAAACWAFVKAFVSGPINRSYETRIVALEADKERCEARVGQLETMLFLHGGPMLRAAMQAALPEERIERLRIEEGAL